MFGADWEKKYIPNFLITPYALINIKAMLKSDKHISN